MEVMNQGGTLPTRCLLLVDRTFNLAELAINVSDLPHKRNGQSQHEPKKETVNAGANTNRS